MLGNFIDTLTGKKKKNERFLSVDIGTSFIKVLELDMLSNPPRLVTVGVAPTPPNSMNSNTIMKPEQVGSQLRALLQANAIHTNKATIGIPGPSAFTKKITIGLSSLKDLEANIIFEAGNYIPHKIEAVHLDYQVLRTNGRSTMDVLLVAVKNEIVKSFLDTLQQAGLEPAIADVDYFALENMFEINYPEESKKTIALVNIGARYSSVNILQESQSLFTGDVGVGGRLYTDALCETLGMQAAEAEQAKAGKISENHDPNLVGETLDRITEHIASELHRQIGFFWNASATDRAIEAIYICGGSAQMASLLEELSVKAGLPCHVIDPFRKIGGLENFEKEFLNELAPSMGVSVGLASRRFGDKKHMVN